MLIRFEVSNFRSIREPVELSMVAIDRHRDATREAPLLGESLLTTAGIYGSNASGKSNVVSAVEWLIYAVRSSLRFWDDGIPVDPFALANDPPATTCFELEMLIDGVRFEYVLELDSSEIHYEALFHYPEKKRRLVFERDGENLKLQRGLGKLSGTRKLLTQRALVLSIARRFDEPTVSNFVNVFSNSVTFGRPRWWRRALASITPQNSSTWYIFRSSDDGTPLAAAELREQALALIRLADLGIRDVAMDVEKIQFSDGEERVESRLRLVHDAGAHTAPLDLEEESDGTQAWFGLIGPVLAALDAGSLLLVDELDASLHPTLCAQLIELFQRPDTNPEGAQLVFTSHDTSLLAYLNRDEVWLTEKRDGVTRLGPLSNFAGERVRRSQNLEAGYLHGRFGGLPNIDQAELLRAMGLVG